MSEPAWASDDGFRILRYRFRIRTSTPACAELVHRALGACRRSDVGDDAPIYQLEERTGPNARLELNGQPLIRNARPADAYAQLVWHVMNEAVGRATDELVVHAGVVIAPGGGAVVLPAMSGGGKTTLTAALVRAGFAYLSDEMAAFDPASGTVMPVPRAMFVKPGTFEALGVSPPQLSPEAARFIDGTFPVTPDDLREGSLGEAAPVRAVIAPAYRAGATTTLEPISRATGLATLFGHAFNLKEFGGSRGVRLLGEVVRSADCYRLAVGRLDEAVEAVAEVTSSAA